jgi:hypothetical protein
MERRDVRQLAILAFVSAMAVGCGGSGGGSETSCLDGVWDCMQSDGSTVEMTISGGTIDAVIELGPISETVMATIAVDGDMLTVVDTGGGLACPMDQRGEYTFMCSDTALSFTLVSDDCMGRMSYFGCDWTRR